MSSPDCEYCGYSVECIAEDNVHWGHTSYTVRCKCTAITSHVTHKALISGGENYAIDVAHQRWREKVDKMHMVRVPSNEENPDSVETGALDRELVWDAVLSAMEMAFWNGNQYRTDNAPIGNDRWIICERILKEKLNDLLDGDFPDR